MDEYKEFLYENSPDWYSSVNTGDLTEQKALRQKLKCKSFKWFMENIAFDLEKFYPSQEPPHFAWGGIQSWHDISACIDAGRKALGISECEDITDPSENQYFVLTWRNEIRDLVKEHCWDVTSKERDAPVQLMECHKSGGNQFWRYDAVTIKAQ